MLRSRSTSALSLLSLLVLFGLILASVPSTFAQGEIPTARLNRQLPSGVTFDPANRITVKNAKLDATLKEISGRVNVVVGLSEAHSASAEERGWVAQRTQRDKALNQQSQVINAARALDPSVQVRARLSKVLNAVILNIDSAVLPALSANLNITHINPVRNYELALSDTVPYIGATAVQATGNKGKGISVAVLDSGIDYTHVAFGGAGTAAAYEAAYGTSTTDARNTTLDGLFPTKRVVGGYDFVGEQWAGSADIEQPDPDPIDCGNSAITDVCDGGHGTHVADIIGGAQGVAPEVDLYAVKVCSAVSTSCSGIAILQGLEFAADPNGDGDVRDHVDIVNMSLGSDYGQNYASDDAAAVENLSKIGVLTVAAAGNAGNRPYIVSTPSAAPSAISVAQTQVPSAVLPLLSVTSPAGIPDIKGAFQPWSVAPTTVIAGPLQYGDGAGGNLNGCAAFAAGSLSGKIVLVDRGACNFTLKIKNINDAGGIAGLIGQNQPADPFEGGDGGDRPITIPGYMISQPDANMLRTALKAGSVTMSIDPAKGVPLIGGMVGSSARGPTEGQAYNRRSDVRFGNLIKPEIGAPGASVSAIVGTGSETGAFGGTSGATPMVAGAAALLMADNPSLKTYEIKSQLMNTAETTIYTLPPSLGGTLAPITRIGGGEVRVDRAVAANAAAWEENNHSAAISFGFVDASSTSVRITKQVTVANYGRGGISYDISNEFRYADDVATGAVSLKLPKTLFVPGRSRRSFEVTLTVDGTKLRSWLLNSGSNGANGSLLDVFEYDGYIKLTDKRNAANNLHIAWQALPRAAAKVAPELTNLQETGDLGLPQADVVLKNKSAVTGYVDVYSLVGYSRARPARTVQGGNDPNNAIHYVGVQTYNDGCGDGIFAMAFAVNTYDRITMSNFPYEIDVALDTNMDGTDDYIVFTGDLGYTVGGAVDGRSVTWVYDVATGDLSAAFYVSHGTNSANTLMLICSDQIGMTAANYFQPMLADVSLWDNYFLYGPDNAAVLANIEIAPLGERYVPLNGSSYTVPGGGKVTFPVIDFAPTGYVNASETGLLFFNDGSGIAGAPEGEEATVLFAPGARPRGGH